MLQWQVTVSTASMSRATVTRSHSLRHHHDGTCAGSCLTEPHFKPERAWRLGGTGAGLLYKPLGALLHRPSTGAVSRRKTLAASGFTQHERDFPAGSSTFPLAHSFLSCASQSLLTSVVETQAERAESVFAVRWPLPVALLVPVCRWQPLLWPQDHMCYQAYGCSQAGYSMWPPTMLAG